MLHISRKRLFGTVSIALLLQSASIARIYAEETKEIEKQLKAALLDAEKKMGDLTPWQKTIFSEEVIPQYQRFIRDYRISSEGVKAEIDQENLKKYLSFYGPDVLKEKNNPILVLLKTDANCKKCMESSPKLKQLVQNRLTRRGLTPIWVNSKEVTLDEGSGISLEQKLTEVAKDKKAVGVLALQWSELPPDDSDTAHADEKRYELQTFMKVGETTLPKQEKELSENEKFESFGARFITQLFIDLGAKTASNTGQGALGSSMPSVGTLPGTKEERLIQVSGIKDFAHYRKVRELLQTQLKDLGNMEDRKFSRGSVSFAVFTPKPMEDLKKQVEAMQLDSGTDPLTVEVK